MRLFSTASAHFDLDQIEVSIPSKAGNGRIYLTWQPVESSARLVFAANKDREVTLRNAGKAKSGRLVFGLARDDTQHETLKLTLPKLATPVPFWIAGKEASSEDGDAVVEVVGERGTVLATIAMMVRIRKDAAELSVRERNRFLWAMGQLNARGAGEFKTFRNMHSAGMELQAHGMPAFLPWHRAYMLDLERALQAISPSVALPYWRFDEPAPTLFTARFMGPPSRISSLGTVQDVTFAPTNPLYFWNTDSIDGVQRAPLSNWDSNTSAWIAEWNPLASAPPLERPDVSGALAPWVITESATLLLGTNYQALRPRMERRPHNAAHASWDGFLSSVPTAAKDPLFFLLHANIDRLWARWQKQLPSLLMDKTAPEAFYTEAIPGEFSIRDGQKRLDTMWPWNSNTTGDYPNFQAGGDMNGSPITAQPPAQPTIEDMIDYQGVHSGTHLGFDYDDVKYR